MRKVTKILLLSIIILTIFLISTTNPITANSIAGVTPSNITMDNLLKGATYYRTMRVFSSGNDSVSYNLNASGEIQSWVSFYKSDNYTNPINNITTSEHKKIVYIQFKIPLDISNGLYEGNVYAETIPRENTENVSGMVKLRFPITIAASVTGEQILSGKVNEIRTQDVEVDYPLIIETDFINTGNVIATPTIEVDITREGWLIESFNNSDTNVEVDSGKIIETIWDTANHEPGKYNANVSVLLNGDILESKTLTFEILPRGTFTREGTLTDFSYEGNLESGETIILKAKFENTGKIEINAKFEAEVYIDGRLIDIIESEERPVLKVGETYNFTTYLKIEETGTYEIKGTVIYETSKTDTKIISFEIKDAFLENSIIFVVIIIGIVGIVVAYFIINKKNKNIIEKIYKKDKRKKKLKKVNKINKKKVNKKDKRKKKLKIFNKTNKKVEK